MSPGESSGDEHAHDGIAVHSVGFHVALLVANMLPIVLLSKSMAKIIDFQVAVFAAPAALGGGGHCFAGTCARGTGVHKICDQ